MTALPNPTTLIDGLMTLERALASLEQGFAGQNYTAASNDAKIHAVANGLGRLVSVTIDSSLVVSVAAQTLADRVKDVINSALTASNTATQAAMATAAKTLAIPGLPAQGQTAPGFTFFASSAGSLSTKILAANPCNTSTRFTCKSGPVTAIVSGHRLVVTLTYTSPLPTFVPHLEDSTVDAVNCAIDKSTDRPDDTAGAIGPIAGSAATFSDLVLYSSNSLDVELGATVKNATGSGFGKIGNAGTGTTKIWSNASVGDILSRGPVWLDPVSHVHGSVRTSSTVFRGAGSTVDGTVTQNAMVVLPDLALTVAFPATMQAIVEVLVGQQKTTAPGPYHKIHVATLGRLTLTSGVYFCDELWLDVGGTVLINGAQGPVFIYVRNILAAGAAVVDAAGGAPNVFIAYMGILPIVINTPFNGTLVAPNAAVSIFAVPPPGHQGAFHAKSVELETLAVLQHRPFSVPYDKLPGTT